MAAQEGDDQTIRQDEIGYGQLFHQGIILIVGFLSRNPISIFIVIARFKSQIGSLYSVILIHRISSGS